MVRHKIRSLFRLSYSGPPPPMNGHAIGQVKEEGKDESEEEVKRPGKIDSKDRNEEAEAEPEADEFYDAADVAAWDFRSKISPIVPPSRNLGSRAVS